MKVAASIVFSVSSFISLVFMARYVDEAYGMMMWGMSFVTLFNAAMDLSFHAANIKKISEGKDLNKCVSTYLAIRIMISVMMICLVLSSSLLMGCLGINFPEEFWMVTWVFIVYYVLDNLLFVMNGTFIGRLEAGKESVVLAVSYLVRAAFLITFALLGVSAVVLSMGYVIGLVCALIVAYILFRPLKVRLVRPAFFREYVAFIAPLALPGILISVIAYADKILIGASFDEIEVGFYTAAAGVVYSLITLGSVMNSLLLSHMTKLYAEGKKEEARNTLWAAQKYLAVIMLPATAFFLIFGRETAVALFGAGFANSGPILTVLGFNIFLTILTGMFAQVLLSMNRAGPYGRAAAVYALFTLALFSIMIPGGTLDSVAGGVGAATALVAGNFLFVVLLTVIIKRSGASGLYPRIYIHMISAAAVGALLYMIRMYFEPSDIIWLILLAFLSMAVYSLILIAVKEITRKDVAFIKNTLDPRNIYDDLKDELKGT